jgi:hypothetical protein
MTAHGQGGGHLANPMRFGFCFIFPLRCVGSELTVGSINLVAIGTDTGFIASVKSAGDGVNWAKVMWPTGMIMYEL